MQEAFFTYLFCSYINNDGDDNDNDSEKQCNSPMYL